MSTPPGKIIWDPLVRSTHWLVASIVLANLVFLESGDALHRWGGYGACGLVLIRTVWGFIGTKHARFSDWFPKPSVLLPYLRLLTQGKEPRVLGHNPAGAVMMLFMWVLVLSLGGTGFLMGTDLYFGEEWLQDLHSLLSDILLVSVGIHVFSALVVSWRHKENLISSMITGRKRED
ncbi:MAG: cytochrome b/b6 domain-containing protein [Pseudomonas sp.]|uniref:cytochrome b/b6 domain-containing protein n=1 Tax=Pseudomonas sp. TaxID=306 RepID=UPI003D10E5E5